MWGLLSAIFAAVVGFGAGATGLTGTNSQSPRNVNTYSKTLCYNAETNVKLTLKWPDNFINLKDNRLILNPTEFSGDQLGPNYKNRLKADGTFSTDETSCKPMMLTSIEGTALTTRNYIRIRRNVRISSCKTDELSGPYNADRNNNPPTTCDNLYPFGPGPAAKDLRGSCAIDQYPDLRKVAEVKVGTATKEIFLVPFTHNAACAYDPNKPNCGPGTYASLKDFIYVLDKRDAFDPNNPSKCKVKWDAGTTDKQACSHFFDVYMSEDTYKKVSGTVPVPTTDKNWGTYDFFKQAIQNCHEQNLFIPTFDSPTGEIPPKFITNPIVVRDFYVQQNQKIQPRDAFEVENYKRFFLSNPSLNPLKTNFMQIAKAASEKLNACQPGKLSANEVNPKVYPLGGVTSCYVPLGQIIFQKYNSNEKVAYNVFSLPTTPQTFYFQDKSGKDLTVYQYTITDQQPDAIKTQAPALQLNALDFMAENTWTWATPACKPAIYLYPQKETELSVKLNIDGRLTDSTPSYDDEKGWQVIAYPNGKLITYNPQPMTYPYLYYEAEVNNVSIPKEGWVVENSKLKSKIPEIMKELNFNDKEIADFLSFWLPNLQEKPYYFVTLLPEKMVNEKETINLSVAPDTMIRARFIFEGLDAPISVNPLKDIPTHQRNGFVLTDWGGALGGKSCSDLLVK